MTDISNLKPGDALTYEQAMALPDGAVVSALWNNEEHRSYYTVGSNDAFGVPKKFGGSSLEHKEYWGDHQWHSVRLEYLPELPVWVITCDRCGTTYKNNERHTRAACEPSEPSPRDGMMMQKDNNNAISEKLSQNDADVVTKRQAREIEKLAAITLLDHRRSILVFSPANEPIIDLCRNYIEAYDYAKSIGAISQ